MITFHDATVAEIPLIRQLAAATWSDTYRDILSPEQLEWMFDWMYSPESLRRQMEEEQQRFFIAYYNEQPCGYISVERQQTDLFHFQKIYVVPQYHGLGIGKALVEKGIEYIRSLDVLPCRIELNVNRQNKAVGFYKRMGFKIASEGDFDIGHGYFMNDYIMSLTLEAK